MHQQTLFILPGWGGSHTTWEQFVLAAKKEFAEVVVIDLPCFGDEPCPQETWGVEEYSHFVQSKLTTYPAGERILLGHSFGGAVAALLVANNPDLVSTLILSGPAIIRPKRYIKRCIFGTISKFGKLVVAILPSKKWKEWARKALYKLAGSPDGESVTGIEAEIFKKVIRQDLQHILPAITTPTCVVQGTADTYVLYSHGKKIAEHIPHASFVSIEGGTHGLHIHRTQELLGTITEFISSPMHI